ncbi:MAG: cytochrome c [Thermodesulfobacteriota bacterium]
MKLSVTLLSVALVLAANLAQGQAPVDLLPLGKEIFLSHCADCHRANGQGLPHTFPALAKNPFVVGDASPVIATVLNGRRGQLGRMPSWRDKLDDNQIAAVVTYIRQAWGNRAAPVTPVLVAPLRKK